MKRILSCLVLAVVAADFARAQSTSRSAPAVQFDAELAIATAVAKGALKAGGVQWTCTTTHCSGRGPGSDPAAICAALVKQVGLLKTFVAAGKSVDMKTCNGTMPSMSAAPAPVSASGSFFAVSVADLDASVAWYQRAFDLRVAMRPPKMNGAAVALLQGQGISIELIASDSAMPLSALAPKSTSATGVYGFAKAGFLVDDFAATMDLLRSRGVRIMYGPFPPRADQKANVIVADTAGNLIQIIAK